MTLEREAGGGTGTSPAGAFGCGTRLARPRMSLDFPLEGWPVGALRAIWHGTFGIVGSHVSRGAYRMSAPGFSVASHLAAISYREREAGNQDFFLSPSQSSEYEHKKQQRSWIEYTNQKFSLARSQSGA